MADGELSRLMVFMPPRHGKSETVSRLFSAYYLLRHPERWVGVTSYAEGLAFTLSRNARNNYQQGGGALSQQAYAVSHWETGRGGGMWAAGVGGGITGKGFHLGIIDDPLKDAEEAASETIREKIRDWYQSTFSTRQEPDASIVVIQTRWHESDLSGWLLERESDEPEGWHIVCLPAIAEDLPDFPTSCTVEPDWRAQGEALCPERYPLERLQKIERRIGPYYWASLYQQRPAPREGNLFKRTWFEIVGAAPAEAKRVRFWDRAATAGAGDFTAGALVAYKDGLFYIEDVRRGQWASGERDKVIVQQAQLDGAGVVIGGEQEPGSSGVDAAKAFVRMLAGWSVYTEPSTGSKAQRADPLASQAQAGNVKLVKGAWTSAFLDELCAFPAGAHDDQVDAAAAAFNRLARQAVRPAARSYQG